MRIILKWLAGTMAVALLAAGGTTWWAYSAVTQPPDFYQQILDADPEQMAEGSRQLESRVSALVSDAQKPGTWQSTITAEEMNGWLAVKLPESYPDLLPSEIKDPRVALSPEAFRLACRTQFGRVESVVTLALDAYVTDQNVLAIEIKTAHAGTLPLPTAPIAKDLAAGTAKTDLPVRWTQSGGQHVMLVDIDGWGDDTDEVRRLERVELADGALFLSGVTGEVSKVATHPNRDGDSQR